VIEAALFVEQARRRGATLWSGVPCSYLLPFINYVLAAPGVLYLGAANEGDAVATAAGAAVGGRGSVAIFQNSGLGNAVNPLTSLTETMRIPILLVVTWRGEPGGPADEPQHELMGAITTDLLSLMRIRWEYFPVDAAEVGPVLDRATAYMAAEQRPFALVMRKDSVAPWPQVPPAAAQPPGDAPASRPRVPIGSRADALAAIRRAAAPGDVIVATTGYTGRELYAIGDADGQFYMVGSMGCASSFGLGLALAQPSRRIVVVDGDGAALMRLGAMATLGHQRPANLRHVVIDNGCHESTGGQATVSPSLDFPALAAACGYPRARRAGSLAELEALVAGPADALTFVHVPVTPGVAGTLPRPAIAPPDVTARLRRFLHTHAG
jgi:phosphonopyruvate decarboxylase